MNLKVLLQAISVGLLYYVISDEILLRIINKYSDVKLERKGINKKLYDKIISIKSKI